MRPISTRERLHELHRAQPVRRLRSAHLRDDGPGLVHHHRSAPGRGTLWLAATYLASGAVRLRRLHHRPVVLCPHHRRELIMTITEVTPIRAKAADEPG